MKRCLLWISLLTVAVMPLCAQHLSSPRLRFDEAGRARYNLVISTPKASLTGICLLRSTNDSIVGSVVNEFGIKAFDFIFTARRQQVKLRNVAFFLDKWYIRRVVRSDLRYLLSARRKASSRKSLSGSADSTLVLTNKRHRMEYTFTPLRQLK
ncbi:MAG: hypothetical protein LBL97_09255 [Prevotellaceae bacterium]|jgi:hypothetical protein|nr:hypothetical protein [Prevotellaceae bacterium]